MKKIAVVTPVYNREAFLRDCIESVALVITQNQFELEHIIIDDFSSDNTPSVLESANYEHLKKIYLKSNGGPAKARNVGIESSDADFIFCLDSDDILLQNSLRYLLSASQENQRKWIFGDTLSVGGSLNYLLGKDYHGWNFDSPVDLLVSMFTKKHTFLTNSFYDRQTLLKVRGYDENLKDGENADLAVRLILDGVMPKYLPTTVTLRRIHKTNLSLNNILNPGQRITDLKKSFKKNEEQLKTFLPENKFKEIVIFLEKYA